MSSGNNDNFILYLSETDRPSALSEQNPSKVNEHFIAKILRNDDAVEQVINENLGSVLQKRLCTNSFLEEDLRNKLFENQILSNQSDDIIAEICRESYLTFNLKNNCQIIAAKTGTILNWKSIKRESLARIQMDFIHKKVNNCDKNTLDEIENKFFSSQ